jgi:hypothetical protein
MKVVVLTVLAIFSIQSSSAQVASSCVAPDSLRLKYEKDARQIALKRIYEIHSPDTSFIEVPQAQIDTILMGLAAIFNLNTLLEADSVFKYWCVHDEMGDCYNNILKVKVDTSYAWARQWALLHTYTGYPELDNFMYLHDCYVDDYYCAYGSEYLNNMATIKTHHPLNLARLADSLALFPGVLFTEDLSNMGWGNVIFYEDSTKTYTFVMGWGDCPSGCTSAIAWKYTVNDTCGVSLLSVNVHGEDPYPAFPDCAYHAPGPQPPLTIQGNSTITEIRISPNPVTNALHLNGGQDTKQIQYTMVDFLGRPIASGTFSDQYIIDMSDLPCGLYLLKITDSEGFGRIEKVVKN